MHQSKPVPQSFGDAKATRPPYEPPRIQVMTEKEILNTFQVTQAMATWWVSC